MHRGVPSIAARIAMLLGVAAIVAGLALGVSIVGAVSHDDRGPRLDAAAIAAPSNEAQPRHAAAVERTARRERVAVPVRIEIPSIAVSAPIIRLGLNPDPTFEVPAAPATPAGGRAARGPARTARLSSSAMSTRSRARRVLPPERARPGAEIVVVRRDGSRVRFTVQGSERYPKDEFPTARVYGDTDGSTLRLITCGGVFDSSTGHYVDNTIVYAR